MQPALLQVNWAKAEPGSCGQDTFKRQNAYETCKARTAKACHASSSWYLDLQKFEATRNYRDYIGHLCHWLIWNPERLNDLPKVLEQSGTGSADQKCGDCFALEWPRLLVSEGFVFSNVFWYIYNGFLRPSFNLHRHKLGPKKQKVHVWEERAFTLT